MATVTKFANANSVVTTGWTNPTNAYASDLVYATAAPGKNASITTDFGFPAFTTSDIPAGSTINSVIVETKYFSSTSGVTGALFGVQVNNNGTLLGSETTYTETTGGKISDTIQSSGVAFSDLQTANRVRARIRAAKGNTNTAETWSLDYVSLTVNYTPPEALDQRHARFYADGTESGSTALSAQDNAGNGTVIDSYSEANADSGITMDDGSATSNPGQTFTGNGDILGAVKLYLQNSGGATGNVTVSIYAMTGTYGTTGVPTGSALATSNVIDSSTISSSYGLVTFTFSGANQITLANGTHYCLVANWSKSGPVTALNVGYDGSSPTHGGNLFYNTLGSWVANSSDDAAFYVLDNSYTMDLSSGDVNFGARFMLQETNGASGASTDDYQLTYALNSGAYVNVSSAASIAGWIYPSGYAYTQIYGSGGIFEGMGQSFVMSSAGVVQSLVVPAKKAGTPTDNLVAKIRSGSISGTVLATSDNLACSGLSTAANGGAATFNFSSPPTLTTGTTYYFTVERTGARDTSNYPQLAMITDNPTDWYSNGLYYREDSGSWSTFDSGTQYFDMPFLLLASSAAVNGYNSASLTDGGATTNRLTGGSGSFVAGLISEDGLADNLQITASNYTELLYSLTAVSSALNNGDTLDFKVLINGSALNAYDEAPRITITKSTGTVLTKTQAATTRIANTITKTQSATARIQQVLTKTQNAVSRIANTITKTQSAIARVGKTLTKTQPATAHIIAAVTKTQPATARIAKNSTKTQAAVGRIAQTTTKTQSAIARIAQGLTKAQSAVARIVQPASKTQGATARIANTFTKTQSAISRIAQTFTNTQPSVARIANTKAKTQPAVSHIAVIATKTQGAVSRVATILTKTQSATATITTAAISTKTQPGVARIANTRMSTRPAIARVAMSVTKTQNATARIQRLLSSTQSAVARIVAPESKTQSAIARVANTLTKTQPSVTRIANTVTKAQSAVARISNTFTKTQAAVARIANTPTKTQAAIARIQQHLLMTQSATASIIQSGVSTKTQPATARIARRVSSTQPGVARIQVVSVRTQAGVARISNTKTKAQSAVARLAQIYTSAQTAVAHIAVSLTKTQSAVARVQQVVTKTQSAIARIAQSFTHTQPAIARIANTFIDAQPALARIASQLTSTQPALARIQIAGSATQSCTARIVLGDSGRTLQHVYLSNLGSHVRLSNSAEINSLRQTERNAVVNNIQERTSLENKNDTIFLK